MRLIIHLALTDFKIIFRDKFFRIFLLLPVILFALIVWALPSLINEYEFLIPFLPLFIAIGVIENTQMFCFICTMVLIDEKETNVSKVYGVVPITKTQFILSRMLLPFLFTVLLNILLFIIQPFYDISLSDVLLISFLAAMVVPAYVFAINSFAKNRMQGMVYIKAFNMLVILPIAAFFVPENITYAFSILPTHWIFLSVEYSTKNISIFAPFLIGFMFLLGLIAFFTKKFLKIHFL